MDEFTQGWLTCWQRIGGGLSLSVYTHGEWQLLMTYWMSLPMEMYDY